MENLVECAVTVKCYVRKAKNCHELYVPVTEAMSHSQKFIELCDPKVTKINDEDTHKLNVVLSDNSVELLSKWVFKSNLVTAKVYCDTATAKISCPFCGCEA